MAFYAHEYELPQENVEEQELIKQAFESMGSQVPFQNVPSETVYVTSGQTEPVPGSTVPVSVIGESLPEAKTKKKSRKEKLTSTSGSSRWTTSEYGTSVPIEYVSESESLPIYARQPKGEQTEITSWSGPIPLNEYPVNQDENPEMVSKKSDQTIQYTQEVAVRYLKPPSPLPHGDIVVQHEKSIVPPPAPPIVIRQQPPRPETPPPLVLREAPPKPLPRLETKVISVPGKKVPPPPRKVIVERLPQLPSKPPQIIVERWLPFKHTKRRVIHKRPTEPEKYYEKPRNVIIQWETPNVVVNREYRNLGVVQVNPEEYMSKYGAQVKRAEELPDFVRSVPPPEGLVLASDVKEAPKILLEGDLEALSLVDLDKVGLSELKNVLPKQTSQMSSEYQTETYTVPKEAYTAPSQIYTVPVIQAEVYPVPKETYAAPLQTYTVPVSQTETYSLPKESYVMPSQIYSVQAPVPVYTALRESTNFPVETFAPEKVSFVEKELPSFESVATQRKSPTPYVTAPPQVLMGSHAYLSSLVDDVLNSLVMKSENSINFYEAKEFIKLLNAKLNKSYDDSRAERFLESIRLNREIATMDLNAFKRAIMKSLEFYTIFMF